MLYNYIKILKYIYIGFIVKEDYEKFQHLEEEYKKEVNDKEKQVFLKWTLCILRIC